MIYNIYPKPFKIAEYSFKINDDHLNKLYKNRNRISLHYA